MRKFSLSLSLSVALLSIYFIVFSANALEVIPPGPVIGSSNYLPTAEVNQPYSQTLSVTGGLSPYTWSVIGGNLPNGLNLGSSTGIISSTPTIMGTFNFDVQVTDSNLDTATKNISIIVGNESNTGFVYTRTPVGNNVVSPLTIRIQGIFGVDFCSDPRATNYRIQLGGRVVNGDSGGDQSSTETLAHSQGDIVDDTFSVPITSPSTFYGAVLLCNNANFGILDGLERIFNVIPATPTITTSNLLPTRSVNQPYSLQLGVGGGQAPYSWSVITGALPNGLSLNSSGGLISGTPTVMGTYNFTIQVNASNLESGSKNFSLIIGNESTSGFVYTRTPTGNNVVSPLTIRVQGVFGVDFCTDPRATNYKIQYGGRIVNGDSGGDQNSTVTVSHAQGDIVDDLLNITTNAPNTYYGAALLCNNASFGFVDHVENIILHVTPSVPTIANPTSGLLPTGMLNRNYSYQIGISGGTSPYTWNIIAGSLPSGLSLNSSTGVVQGTPLTTGAFSFTVQVTDSNSLNGTQSFTIEIAPESNTGFIYTRSPSGDTIIYPLTLRVRGVFGYDFCTDPRTTTYRIQYGGRIVNGDSGGIQGSTNYIPHTQGDIVDDTLVLDLAPGIYFGAALLCGENAIFGLIDNLEGLSSILPLSITTSSLPSSLVGSAYSQYVQAINGTLPFNWSLVSGNLPVGLSLNSSTGEIFGTPTIVQTSNFTVQVVDTNNRVATKNLSITVHGNTPVGNPVVGPISRVTLTFSGGVTREGQTTITTSGNGQPPPTGFKLGTPPTYYSISTTAQFIAPVQVCISWTQGQFNNENNLKLWHLEGANWVDLTTSLDTVNNIICGNTNSFSDFAIFEKKQVVAQIDIKPNSYPNNINLGSNGNVSVAIFSTPEFSATAIDPLSVELASAPVELRGNGTPQYSIQDVNNDGLLDMLVHISTEALQLSQADGLANLEANTSDNTEILGSDTIRVIP